MIIDGIDIRTLGMFILRNGSNDFLSFPTRREPDTNDWAEHDGLDVDLSECTFEAKKVSVQLYISAAAETLFKQRLTALETMHFAAGYRTVLVKEFGKTFQLRFLGFSGYRHKGGLAKYGQKSGRLTVEYMMDDPVQYFTAPQPPKGGAVSASHVLLDGADLSGYGIIVKDIYSTSLQPRQAKPVLERTFRTINGITADTGAAPKKAAKQITIDCVMTAGTLSDFYTNYNALFGAVNKAGVLVLGTRNGNFNCYYRAMGGFTKHGTFGGKVRVSFQLIFQTL